MSDWIAKGAERAYWDACRTVAEGTYFVEGCWAWKADDEPSEGVSFEVTSFEGQKEVEVIQALNTQYIDWCAASGFRPRKTYAFEGLTDTLDGRAIDLRA